jgi:hypothetical protein
VLAIICDVQYAKRVALQGVISIAERSAIKGDLMLDLQIPLLPIFACDKRRVIDILRIAREQSPMLVLMEIFGRLLLLVFREWDEVQLPNLESA